MILREGKDKYIQGSTGSGVSEVIDVLVTGYCCIRGHRVTGVAWVALSIEVRGTGVRYGVTGL